MTTHLPTSDEWHARYLELSDQHVALLDRYFILDGYRPGKPLEPRGPVTHTVRNHLAELEASVEHARAEWMRTSR